MARPATGGLKVGVEVAACGFVAGLAVTVFVIDKRAPWSAPVVLGVLAGLAVAALVTRLRSHVDAGDGFASGFRVMVTMGKAWTRRSARVTRPSLARRFGAPLTECGIYLGRTVRPRGRLPIFATLEEVVLMVGPPRMGKTALLGHAVIDAPGPVVVTSTKVDVHALTTVRANRGPVWVLNPEGMAGAASNFKWNPVAGCEAPAVAIERAAYFISGSPDTKGVQSEAFWENSNAKVLRCYLYAAAVAGKRLDAIRDWVNDPDDKEALRILESDPLCPAGWAEALRQVLTTPAEKTRESIFLTLQLTFEFMADPAVADAVLTGLDGSGGFDFERFIRANGALYLLGAHKSHGGMGPLFSALTGYIFEEAKRLSQSEACPARRLDPPVSFVLDEVANICPVPLAQWTSDAGGRGIPLVIAVQSPSQLRERWGNDAAETVWNNANVTVVLGGLKVDKDLEAISALCGLKDEPVRTQSWGQDGAQSISKSVRLVPVMHPAAVREIHKFQVLVLHRNSKPVMAKIRPVWKRWDVRGRRKPASVMADLVRVFGASLRRQATAAPVGAPVVAVDEIERDVAAV